ncbi:MAG: hypothetical protein AAF788_04645 [Pseudomonadota bacterium]
MAARLHRLRRGAPYLGSLVFNLLMITVLALGYQSFVAKGVPNAGEGPKVVAISFFEPPDTDEKVPEIQAEDPETEAEDVEQGLETIPEGNALTQGATDGEQLGDSAPDEDLGEQVTAARAGVTVPSVALPDVDAGEGRPEGIVGVDCYELFSGDEDKALECAGRVILSGWRAEIADLDSDWDRFAGELGTARRQIRYGPLRSVPQTTLSAFGRNPLAVRREAEIRFAQELERQRQLEAYQRFETEGAAQVGTDAAGEALDAATYDPVAPDVSFD